MIVRYGLYVRSATQWCSTFTQNRKVPGSSLTNALRHRDLKTQAQGPNFQQVPKDRHAILASQLQVLHECYCECGKKRIRRLKFLKNVHFAQIANLIERQKEVSDLQKQPPEEKVFLEITQNSQENICARVSLLIKLLLGLRPATLSKKRLWHRCFPVNFAKFLRTPF